VCAEVAARAPGRINLIGEHTDYNLGWVLPAAIELSATATVTARARRRLRFASAQFPDAVEFPLDAAAFAAPAPHWSDSLRGIAVLLDRIKPMPGADVLVASSVPIGAGLSSSAAVEVACALALARHAALELEPAALAQLCQRASHEFAGSRVGIMDFYIAAHARAGHVVVLDTRDLAARWLPWPGSAALLAADSGTRHQHATGDYNLRRAECEAAARALGVAALRDATPAMLAAAAATLDPTLLRRARHVVTENARVLEAAAAIECGQLVRLGRLLNASHASLRHDFEVSCPQLDRLAERCQRAPGVWGARMMGGGFGGSVLVLGEPAALAALAAQLGSPCWPVHPSAGAALLPA